MSTAASDVYKRKGERSRDEIVQRLVKAGVPVAPVNHADDVLNSDILHERNALVPVHWGGAEVAVVPAPTMGFERPTAYHLPQLGEHTDEVRGELAKRAD